MDFAAARMHHRRVRGSHWALWLLLSLPGQVAAQDPALAVEHEAYERAVAAFERGETDVALHVFRELYERTQLPALRFNIGICLEDLGDRAAALEEFEAVAGSEDMDAGTRAEAIEAAARLRALLGAVTVDGPAGGVAVLDETRRCELPCELYVEPGSHRAVLGAAGAEPETFEVAPGGRAALTLAMPVVEGGGPSLGVLTGIGVAVAAIGGGGIIGFGVRTLDVKAAFDLTPTPELQSEGALVRDLANASIGVAALGGVLVLIDVILVATGAPSSEAHARIEGGELVLDF